METKEGSRETPESPGGRDDLAAGLIRDHDLYAAVLGLVLRVLGLELAVGLADHVMRIDLALLDEKVHDRVGALERQIPIAVEFRLRTADGIAVRVAFHTDEPGRMILPDILGNLRHGLLARSVERRGSAGEKDVARKIDDGLVPPAAD